MSHHEMCINIIDIGLTEDRNAVVHIYYIFSADILLLYTRFHFINFSVIIGCDRVTPKEEAFSFRICISA